MVKCKKALGLAIAFIISSLSVVLAQEFKILSDVPFTKQVRSDKTSESSDSYEDVTLDLYNTENVRLTNTLVPRPEVIENDDNDISAAKSWTSFNKTPKRLMEHVKNLTLTVRIGNTSYTLDLSINSLLLASDYKEILLTTGGEENNAIDLYQSHCYYNGVVRGYNDSLAAVSTCSGIVGVFYIGGESYIVEPKNKSEATLSGKHRVYKGSDKADVLKKFRCGGGVKTTMGNRKKRTVLKEWPQDLDKKTRIVEMYIVNDYSLYTMMGYKHQEVLLHAKNIINVASALFQSQDIYLVIVGQEVWTYQKVQFSLFKSNQLLDDFTLYVDTQVKQHHDQATFITAKGPFEDGVVGKAFLARMCGQGSTAFICSFDGYSVATIAEIAAHELGHNFGLEHSAKETGTCECDHSSSVCIMDATDTGGATGWSSCHIAQLKSQESYNNFTCLLDVPRTIFDQGPSCGNGLVEAGEQCDCGKAPTVECNPACCDSATCRLKGSAQCAHGRCCDIPQCKIKVSNSECRAARGLCDVAEYCTGATHLCPSDVLKKNFTTCTAASAPGYCYGGECRNRNSQCAMIFGPGSTSANDDCYSVNTGGLEYANCGRQLSGLLYFFKACASRDVFCGTLHCQGGGDIQLTTFDRYKEASIGQSECRIATFSTEPNLGYPLDGSPCGKNKACINGKCKAASSATVLRNVFYLTYMGTKEVAYLSVLVTYAYISRCMGLNEAM